MPIPWACYTYIMSEKTVVLQVLVTVEFFNRIEAYLAEMQASWRVGTGTTATLSDAIRRLIALGLDQT